MNDDLRTMASLVSELLAVSKIMVVELMADLEAFAEAAGVRNQDGSIKITDPADALEVARMDAIIKRARAAIRKFRHETPTNSTRGQSHQRKASGGSH